VRARLHQGAEVGALRVPASAVVRNADKDYVFVKRAEGFAPLPVQLLSREDTHAVLRSDDLKPGDVVATRGTAALKAVWVGGGE
jgi:membrane fusion protein, heavy metal efflux system